MPVVKLTDAELQAKRLSLFANNSLAFYRTPLVLERAEGVWVHGRDGRTYLDAYNNTVPVGHCNPEVVEAICRQAATLNTHSRYIHELVLDYAEDLICTFPEHLNKTSFTCSGTEANELALRIAASHTGKTGFVVANFAYHGTSMLLDDLSPFAGGTSGVNVRVLKPADVYRFGEEGVLSHFTEGLQEAIDDLESKGFGFAALLVDTVFESGGIFTHPTNFLSSAEKIVHQSGGLFIADEVQAGFARLGETMWGFQRHGLAPDLVSMGKPMANGLPCAAIVGRGHLIDAFYDKSHYFNTFAGGGTVISAAQTVLNIIQRDRLTEHVQEVGGYLLFGLMQLMQQHEMVGDVRGAGLFVGIEIVSDRDAKTPDNKAAQAVINGLLENGILTGSAGEFGNIVKIRPPLIFSKENADYLIENLDEVLTKLPTKMES